MDFRPSKGTFPLCEVGDKVFISNEWWTLQFIESIKPGLSLFHFSNGHVPYQAYVSAFQPPLGAKAVRRGMDVIWRAEP